jgi:hypothetical protein
MTGIKVTYPWKKHRKIHRKPGIFNRFVINRFVNRHDFCSLALLKALSSYVPMLTSLERDFSQEWDLGLTPGV